MAYVQTRIQSRYGKRADESVWLKLQNIHDLGSYLQTAQQTPLRHWILGISATHSSHEIELTLRQKYRGHIDEVVNWVPASWRRPLCWIKRLPDLPVLHYLATGGEPLGWMKEDPALADFAIEDHNVRMQAMRDADCSSLVDALQQNETSLEGWIREWNKIRLRSNHSDNGFKDLERLIRRLVLTQTGTQGDVISPDYDSMFNQFRRIFRRYAFQPASVCAYLAIIMIDLHRIRRDLMQRKFFPDKQFHAEDLLI
jgi:hypothetical protein